MADATREKQAAGTHPTRTGDKVSSEVRLYDHVYGDFASVAEATVRHETYGEDMQAGLPQPFAETVAELYACFESGRVRPEGDRALAGATTIHDVLPDLLSTLGGRTARR